MVRKQGGAANRWTPCRAAVATVVGGCALTLALFAAVHRTAIDAFQENFELSANIRARLVAAELQQELLRVQAVSRLLAAQSHYWSFQSFVAPFLHPESGLHTVAWVPAVPPGRREALERRGQQELGVAFRIAGDATDSPFSYPIFYVEPKSPATQAVVGFDLAASLPHRRALEEARDTGRPAIAGPLPLAAGQAGEGFVVCLPVYDLEAPQTTVAERRDALRGFAVGGFDPLLVLRAALVPTDPLGLPFVLLDLSTPGERREVAGWGSRQQGSSGGWWVRLFAPPPPSLQRFPFAEQPWAIEVAAGQGYLARNIPLAHWLLLPIGLLLNLLLGAYLGSVLHSREALRRGSRQLQNVLDAIPEQVLVLNLDHTVALANAAVWGAPAAANRAPGAPLTCHSLSHGCQTPCASEDHRCPLQMVLADKAPVTVEHRHSDAAGGDRTVELTASPLFGPRNEVIQVVEVSRDITERRRAEEEQRLLDRRLLQAQKAESLAVLAGGIAHDFNNILSGVLGNAELAQRKLAPDSPIQHNLQSIEAASLRAAGLAQQMLAYAGKGQFLLEPVDLNRLLREMTPLLDTALAKRATLSWHLEETLPPLEGDPGQLRQAVLDLVYNAAEAMGDGGGNVEIHTRFEAKPCWPGAHSGGSDPLPAVPCAVLEIQDTGCGMDQETIHKIFDPFFSTKFTGRGLGLPAVFGIVHGHRGAIRVASEPGRGTTIRLWFPCGAAATSSLPGARAAAPTPSPAPPTAPRSRTVLVVDDEPVVRELAQAVLENQGFEVLTAADGPSAIRLYTQRHADVGLVVLDLTMPGMDGAQTLEHLAGICSEVQVLVSSGYSKEQVAATFAGKNIAGFLHKPYRPSALCAKVEELMEAGRRSG